MTSKTPPDVQSGRISGHLEAASRFASRHQLLTLTTAIILVVTALGSVAVYQLRTQALAEGERLTASFAHIIEEQVTRTLQAVDLRMVIAADQFGELTISGRLNDETGHKLMLEYGKGLPYVRSLWVLDAKGRLTYDSDTGNIGINLSDREYFKIFLAQPRTVLHIGTPVRSRTNGKWLIAMARALHNERGEFTGVMVAALETAHFNNLWREVDLGDGGIIGLFHQTGELMMRSPEGDTLIGRQFPEMPMFATSKRRPVGSFRIASDFDSKSRMYAYRTLTAFPQLVIVVGQSVDHVLIAWRLFANLTGAVWALGSMAIGVLGIMLTRTLAQKERGRIAQEDLAQRMALATDAAGIAVWEWDLVKDAWTVSPTFFSMRGLKAEQGLETPTSWLEGLHPNDSATVEAISRALRSGAAPPQAFEARWLHADGSYRWIRVIARDFSPTPGGRPAKLLGVMLDVTALHLAQEERAHVVDRITDAFVALDNTGRYTFANAQMGTMFGVDHRQIIGKYVWEVFPKGSGFRFNDAYAEAMKTQTSTYTEEFFEPIQRWVGSHIYPSPDGLTISSQDITERKRTRAELDASLREKEFLLREVHHRVKNNLQVISSLMRLESGRSLHAQSKSVLTDMQNRIRTMALLHESLYRAGTFANAALDVYLRELASQVFRVMAPAGRDIRLKLALASTRVGMDQAAPCGLLVNELISNSLKHGFAAHRTGEVSVELSLLDDGNRLCLKVSDTGIGLPADFETRRKTSLGMQLVNDLASQLDGVLEIGPGAVFTVTFVRKEERHAT